MAIQQIKSRRGSVLFECEVTEQEQQSGIAVRAALERAVQARANLADAYLARAYLTRAYLTDAYLTGANLTGAYLTDAYLTGANLTGANLTGAYLADANLTGANLTGANLTGANLADANLTGANLADANLTGANLTGANLTRANLADAKNADLAIAKTRILPDGDLIGWKKCTSGVIVKLRIPAGAKRSHAFGRKCRAEFVDVLEVFGGEFGVTDVHGPLTEYRVGQRVRPDEWDDNWQDECSHGIHFFITRQEAEDY